ncbi:hypothetical protein BC936DRAFT_142727 [Jimgerdemannia flammicorona]|uniref:Uncharacterized protein n=1 Tax=Jimgerdemannia flammicorona TaxID=994334 RepID=A0A432ZZY8_9FUNG|nr:hypothetical protein BC936DRAFT_142727 [Jimgerdemannia flammicorona]
MSRRTTRYDSSVSIYLRNGPRHSRWRRSRCWVRMATLRVNGARMPSLMHTEYQLLVLTERNQGSSEELEDGDLEEMYDFGDSDPHEITMDPIESAGVGQFTGLTRVMELERVPGEGGAGESDEYTMAERCGSGCAGVKTSEMFMDVDRSGKEGLMSGDTGTGMGRMQRRSLRVEQQVV